MVLQMKTQNITMHTSIWFSNHFSVSATGWHHMISFYYHAEYIILVYMTEGSVSLGKTIFFNVLDRPGKG